MPGFNKKEYKNIAQALIAVSGMQFDYEAFTECDDLLTDDEIHELIQVIDDECQKTLSKISNKLNRSIPATTTKEIIEAMYFEDED